MQALAVVAALLIHEGQTATTSMMLPRPLLMDQDEAGSLGLRDRPFGCSWRRWSCSTSPIPRAASTWGFSSRRTCTRRTAYCLTLSSSAMVAWMLVVCQRAVWRIALGRKPLLVVGLGRDDSAPGPGRLAQAPWQVLALQVLDGVAQGLFIVVAAAWMTDRLADHKRVGEAQVLVGSALVAGSAIGPTLSGLIVDDLGYRGMFWLLAGIGTVAP